jgi:hypothetical protein
MSFSCETADATRAEPGFVRREPKRGDPVLSGKGGGPWGNHGFPHAEKEG